MNNFEIMMKFLDINEYTYDIFKTYNGIDWFSNNQLISFGYEIRNKIEQDINNKCQRKIKNDTFFEKVGCDPF